MNDSTRSPATAAAGSLEDPSSTVPFTHDVQFYDDDAVLRTRVAAFLCRGGDRRQPLLVIATPGHLEQFKRELVASGFDLDSAEHERRFITLEARDTLESLLNADRLPDWARFDRTIGDRVRGLRAAFGRPVCAFGEMVDLLWRDGLSAAALRLEGFWNDLGAAAGLSLLCGYSMDGFPALSDADAFHAIMAAHGHVDPASMPPGNVGDTLHLREVARFQQQRRAFEREVRRRSALEVSLRHALDRSRQAEAELRDFVDNAAEGMHWVGPDGTILWANQAELDLLGYTREEYVGRSIVEFHIDRGHILDLLTQLLRGDTLRDVESRMRCKDGSIRHVLLSSNAYSRDGQFVHTRCFTRDVTARKAAEDVSVLLASIVRSSEDAIVSKDPNGIIQSWNPAAERMFGYTAAEAIGRSIRMIVPGPRQAEEDRVLDRLRAGEYIDHFETVRLCKDGQEVPVSLTVSPVRDGHGRVIGASSIARDITVRRQLEAERDRLLDRERVARHEAERANRVKDEFLALLSHELRTPLNAVLGWTQILRGGRDDLAPIVRRALDVIERNARAQARLIDDLLDISRIVSGKLQLDMSPVEVSAVAAAAVESARPAAAAGHLQLHLHAEGEQWTLGDTARLHQVISNLLSNAIKFTPELGRIDVTIDRHDDEARVVVKDTGQGIAREFLPFVFDRFRQGSDGTNRPHGGLGLGLAVARSLVESHSGTLQAESDGAGLGATFTVVLPRTRTVATGRTAGDQARVDLDGLHILAVDDHQDAREVMRHLLERQGAAVVTAGSVDEAMRILGGQPVDVLLADIGMPDRDGFALIEAVRGLDASRRLPAIAVTAYAGDEHHARALTAGFDDYVTKPVSPSRLARAIRGLVPDRGINASGTSAQD